MAERITDFKEFYAFYLNKHQKTGTRIFHFLGILLVLFVVFYVLKSGKERFLWYVPIFGLGLPWFGNAVFEKNFATTFNYPFWSIVSDFKMFFELLTRKQKFKA